MSLHCYDDALEMNMMENGGAHSTSESPLHDSDYHSSEDHNNGEGETLTPSLNKKETNFPTRKCSLPPLLSDSRRPSDNNIYNSEFPPNQDKTNVTKRQSLRKFSQITTSDSAYGTSINLETPDVYEFEEPMFFTSNEGGERRVRDWQLGSEVSLIVERRDRERPPKYPDLAEETWRRETFIQYWPKQMLQHLIPDFVKCGFFYTSKLIQFIFFI